jgi:hypothetical protein
LGHIEKYVIQYLTQMYGGKWLSEELNVLEAIIFAGRERQLKNVLLPLH